MTDQQLQELFASVPVPVNGLRGAVEEAQARLATRRGRKRVGAAALLATLLVAGAVTAPGQAAIDLIARTVGVTEHSVVETPGNPSVFTRDPISRRDADALRNVGATTRGSKITKADVERCQRKEPPGAVCQLILAGENGP